MLSKINKYIYFALALLLLVLLMTARLLYSDNKALKQEKMAIELSLKDAESKNSELNRTISLQAETQKNTDETQQAINEMSARISKELQRTQYNIKNQIKGLPCYDQTIPADAIDAICIMQPSNSACHANDDKSKSGNSSGVNAAKTKTN